MKLGINVEEKDIRVEFNKIDKDMDEDISFNEFKEFVV